MPASLRQMGRRFMLVLGGEVLQSAFHFLFNIALLHALTPRDYGIFAIVMVMGGLALTYIRALCGIPAALHIPLRLNSRSAAAYETTFGTGALVCAVVIGSGVAATLHLWLGSGALPGGVFVGLWCLRSYLRIALYARGKPTLAMACDLAFAGSGVLLGLLLLYSHGSDLLDAAFGVLAIANATGIVAALTLARRPIRLSLGRATRRRYRSLLRQLAWSCAGVTTANVQAQGQVLLIAAIAGPAAYAPIAAMFVFFAPLRLAATALANMIQPDIARQIDRREWSAVRRLLAGWTAVMLGMGLLAGIGLWVALPWIDAPVFRDQPKFVIGSLAWLILATSMLYVMPKVLLEVIRAFRLITVMAAVAAVVGASSAAVLLVVASPAWSLAGSLASEIVVFVWCWIAVAERLRPQRDGAAAVANHLPRKLRRPIRDLLEVAD